MLPAEIERHRFGVEEYHRMAEVGILFEEDRVKLIHGEIVRMTPIGGRHISCVNRLTILLVEFSARRYVVSIQNPLRLDDEREFEPDSVFLRERPGEIGLSVPTSEDALLVIEVAETSLYRDRNIKLPRYVRARVPEVCSWTWGRIGSSCTPVPKRRAPTRSPGRTSVERRCARRPYRGSLQRPRRSSGVLMVDDNPANRTTQRARRA